MSCTREYILLFIGYVQHKNKVCGGDYVYPPVGKLHSLHAAKTACDKRSDCKCISLHKCDRVYGYKLHKGTAMKTPAFNPDCSWVNISVKTNY